MIHIFCALPCEAQPIIKNFKLTELKQFNFFRLYQSKNEDISLTVTGVGKLNAAAAISYIHACLNTQVSDIWLNVGIAGHKNISIGDVRLANKITDGNNGAHYYPQIIFKSPCQSTALITLDKPSTNYRETLFDMEASAFYQMAIRIGTAELIHCLKIISDNTERTTAMINADSVIKMITEQMNCIEDVMNYLKPLSKKIDSITAEPKHLQRFIEKWHFTQSESFQLSRLLRQWDIRLPNEDIIQSVASAKTGKIVLKTLRERIINSEFTIHD